MKIDNLIRTKSEIKFAKDLLQLFLNKNTSPVIDLFLDPSIYVNTKFTVENIKDYLPGMSYNVIETVCNNLSSSKIKLLTKLKGKKYTVNSGRMQYIAIGLSWICAKKNFTAHL